MEISAYKENQSRNWAEEIDKIAQKELNEDPKTRQLFIEEIRDWIANNDEFKGRTGQVDFHEFNAEQITACVVLFLEAIIEDPRTQVFGLHVIGDAKGTSFSILPQCTPWFIWRTIKFWQKTMPIRIKSIHVINLPPILYVPISIAKPLLSKKNKIRLFIHKAGLDSLFETFSSNQLSTEVNGTAGPAKKYADALIESFINSRGLNLHNKKYGWKKDGTFEND